jgi:hypothetical protein
MAMHRGSPPDEQDRQERYAEAVAEQASKLYDVFHARRHPVCEDNAGASLMVNVAGAIVAARIAKGAL